MKIKYNDTTLEYEIINNGESEFSSSDALFGQKECEYYFLKEYLHLEEKFIRAYDFYFVAYDSDDEIISVDLFNSDDKHLRHIDKHEIDSILFGKNKEVQTERSLVLNKESKLEILRREEERKREQEVEQISQMLDQFLWNFHIKRRDGVERGEEWKYFRFPYKNKFIFSKDDSVMYYSEKLNCRFNKYGLYKGKRYNERISNLGDRGYAGLLIWDAFSSYDNISKVGSFTQTQCFLKSIFYFNIVVWYINERIIDELSLYGRSYKKEKLYEALLKFYNTGEPEFNALKYFLDDDGKLINHPSFDTMVKWMEIPKIILSSFDSEEKREMYIERCNRKASNENRKRDA